MAALIFGIAGLICGFGMANGFQGNKSADIDLRGLWINDIYHTCTYVDFNNKTVFNGYCYWQEEMPDFNSETCITGCKLQADYNEDTSYCENHCKTTLLEN